MAKRNRPQETRTQTEDRRGTDLSKAKPFLFLMAVLFLFAFMPGDRAVLAASPDLANGHFQLQAVVVDNAEGTPLHRLFLLDTDTGRVWRYQPVFINANGDGTASTIAPEGFVLVPMLPSKQ